MNELLNIMSKEFWLGMGGGFIATGHLTQVFKFLIEKISKKPVDDKWKAVIAFPSAFIVAILIQLAIIYYSNVSIPAEGVAVTYSWGLTGALTVVYAAASAYVYRFFIKKIDPDASS